MSAVAVLPPVFSPGYKYFPMSRAAVMDPPPVYKGKSKIPKLDSTYHGVPTERPKNVISSGNPSRLERMQVNFQRQLMQQKEEKMIHIFEENQKKALTRTNSMSKPAARDFFQQRRHMMENGNTDVVPLMNRNYQKKEPPTSGAWTDPKPPVYKQQTYQNRHLGYKKMSAGRDKSNPLAPIERNNSNDGEFAFPRKPQIFGRPRTKDSTTQEKRPMAQDFGPKSAPGTLVRRTPSKENLQNGYVNTSPSDDTPPPNLSHLKSVQKQKLKTQGYITNGQPPRGPPAPTKLTDFQKWQMEQDQARADRLKKYQSSVADNKPGRGFGGGFEYEEEDEDDNIEDDMETEEANSRDIENEIQKKQKEIMAKIAAQQAELERLQQERQEEEEEARRERERRKKREAERQKQQKLEEERRRKEEDERAKREEEEELARIQKKLREERAREAQAREAQAREAQMRMQSQYDEQSEYNNDRLSHNSHHREPVPPSKPKPPNKSQHRVRRNEATPRQVNRTPPVSMEAIDNTTLPPPSSDLKLFEQAAQQEDAYDAEGMKLVACSKCGRKFASDRLQKHMNACDNLTKKRKVMDPTKMRVAGTDFEKYNGPRNRRQRTPPKKPSNWRAKHESFINNIRYARQAKQAEENGTLADLPPPPPSENPDYVQCQYCNRKFNPTAAERHIPRCKDIKARPAPLKRR